MQTHHPVKSVSSLETGNTTAVSELSGCFALVWTRGISEHEESGILLDVKKIKGVTSVQFTRKDPHILLASYDPHVTNNSAILSSINRPHIQARIVGC